MFRVIAFLFLSSAACHACSCSRLPDCGGFHSDAKYFIGIPVSRRVVPGDKRWGAIAISIAIYTVKIIEPLSDTAPSTGETEVRTGTGGADCSWHFRIGEPYLFETYSSESGSLSTNLCTWTGELNDREVIIRSLRSLKSGKKPASLLGRVVQWNRAADESKGEETRTYLAGISVMAHSERGETWRSISDRQGVVTFESLPPGKYSLTPELPQNLVLYSGQNIGHDFSQVVIPALSDSKPGFCRAYLEGMPSSGIEGRVLTGLALRNPVVTAWLVKNGNRREIEDDFLENGSFQLHHLPSGRYEITLSDDYGRHKLPTYTQTVQVRDRTITRVILTPKQTDQSPK
jgi:hypothetical protein